MKAVELHPEAWLDLLDSIEWCETSRKGLGKAVRLEYQAALRRLRDNPFLYAEEDGVEVRIAPLRRFPFGIIYVIETARIWVVAVADLRRDRRRYLRRLNHG